MQDKNVDFCGILNLLSALKKAGFPKAELEQVAVRIAVQTGATIPISSVTAHLLLVATQHTTVISLKLLLFAKKFRKK